MGQVRINRPASGDIWESLGKTFAEVYANTASGSGEITLDMGKEYLVIAVSLGSAPWQNRAWELYKVQGGTLSVVASHALGGIGKMKITLSGSKLTYSHHGDYCYFSLAVVEAG